jgi:multidrug efflux pump subunit AcrA (membrane-fusion protein)
MTPRKLKLLALAFILALLALLALACSGSKAQSNKSASTTTTTTTTAPQIVEVTTAPAIVRQLPRFIEATGSLAGNEQTDVAPAVAGKVVSVGVDLGSYVKRGGVLVHLDDRDARIRLEQAQAQVVQAQAAVRQAEARIGLRAGQAFNPERVADVAAARVALDLAEKQLRRFERLIESGDVSRSSYDQQKAQRDQLQQQYETALNAARQNYAAILTARAAVTAAQTQIETQRKAIADAVVTSPISGYVADRPADIGEYVTTSTKVATVVSTNPLRLRIDIPEQTIQSVRVGESVSVNVSAYPDRAFSGHIARVSPNVTQTSRTLTVEAEVDNGDGSLKPGQFATVRIQQPVAAPALLVPARAVHTEGASSHLFVIKDGRAEMRLVQLGQTEGDLVEIRTGIAAGEQVATSNIEALSDGSAVRQQ